MKILICRKSDEKQIKEFVSKNLEEIFHSPAIGLEDLDNIDKSFELFLVAKENNDIVGTIGIKKEGDCARITRMYVSKSKRGKGLGKTLIKMALGHCKGKFNRVFLTTYEQMNSVKFYEKMGFQIFKKEKDVVYMNKFLDK